MLCTQNKLHAIGNRAEASYGQHDIPPCHFYVNGTVGISSHPDTVNIINIRASGSVMFVAKIPDNLSFPYQINKF